ncbi:DUF4177 domain-containing protein [Bacillus ndiopicus]|uniref:DUF4177 domain-containing protein n=1 Tax=Bacillus ndiopicus TaxID=1347368 RepID=UPI0005A874E0|nr:hypothetical protein [Bacillus ndiopicus]
MKWEYKRLLWDPSMQGWKLQNNEAELEKELAYLGLEGWELVSERNSKITSNNRVEEVTYTFKRPIEE